MVILDVSEVLLGRDVGIFALKTPIFRPYRILKNNGVVVFYPYHAPSVASELGASGVLYYTLETTEFIATKKMVILE